MMKLKEVFMQSTKNLLKKSGDPYLALMAYHSTSLETVFLLEVFQRAQCLLAEAKFALWKAVKVVIFQLEGLANY